MLALAGLWVCFRVLLNVLPAGTKFGTPLSLAVNLPALCRCTINAFNNDINPYYTTPTHKAEAMTEFFNYL